MIGEAKAWGWMHDFGEYVPLDSHVHDESDPFFNHNDYSLQWAKVVEEAIAESNCTYKDEIIPFMRTGSTYSPSHQRLMWMGDQIPSWDEYDGLFSALIGRLNAGFSGFTLSHSDIGGYTTLAEKASYLYGGHFVRTKELLQRWIEMNAFADMI